MSQSTASNSGRVMEEFKAMLDQYTREGHKAKYKDQFYILSQLDLVIQAFDCLQTEGFSLQKAEKALALLSELLFIPKYLLGKRFEPEVLDK